MPVTFHHAAHVATVWLPELSPTRSRTISMLVALLFVAGLTGAVAWMFAALCLDRPHPVRFGVISAVAVLALVAAVPGMRHRISGPAPIASASASPNRDDALRDARAAAIPASHWHAEAKAQKAPKSSTLTWTDDDLRKLSTAAQTKAKLTATYPDSRITVDSTEMDAKSIAAHGTSYLTSDGKRVRCVAHLRDITQNNVGQPVSATLSEVACQPAS